MGSLFVMFLNKINKKYFWTTMRTMNLNVLKPNQKAKIVSIDSSDLAAHLVELGCVNGQTIELMYQAPMNGPKAFLIGGYTLALRISEANLIQIEILEN